MLNCFSCERSFGDVISMKQHQRAIAFVLLVIDSLSTIVLSVSTMKQTTRLSVVTATRILLGRIRSSSISVRTTGHCFLFFLWYIFHQRSCSHVAQFQSSHLPLSWLWQRLFSGVFAKIPSTGGPLSTATVRTVRGSLLVPGTLKRMIEPFTPSRVATVARSSSRRVRFGSINVPLGTPNIDLLARRFWIARKVCCSM